MKSNIPRALREQVWLANIGKTFSSKCSTPWCSNTMTVFDFQCGHDIPESKGGETIIENLIPICGRCNLSMSDNYTFQEWSKLSPVKRNWFSRYFCCCIKWRSSSDTKESGIKFVPRNMSQKDRHTKLHGNVLKIQQKARKTSIGIGMRKNPKT